MGAPPNPFDQAAVDEYLADQEQKQASKDQAHKAVESPSPAGEALETDPAVEALTMLDYWAERGPEVYTAALEAIAQAVTDTATGLAEHGTDAEMEPAAVTGTALGKKLRDAGQALYNAGRGALWTYRNGRAGTYKLEDGRSYKFNALPRVSRSVDYPALQAEYPDVYASVVTEKPADPNKPGRLTL